MVEAGGAHSSRIERVPLMTAATRPEVLLAGRPAAERTSNAGAGEVGALLLIGLSIQDHGRFGGAIREHEWRNAGVIRVQLKRPDESAHHWTQGGCKEIRLRRLHNPSKCHAWQAPF
jgi:hypothetical protein